jgi:hypothetical protein
VDLKIPLPGQEAAKVQAKGKETGKEAHLPPITDEILEAVRAKHKIVPVLIELRQLLKSGWRFVDRETYEKVKNGATVTLLRRVRFHKQSKKM